MGVTTLKMTFMSPRSRLRRLGTPSDFRVWVSLDWVPLAMEMVLVPWMVGTSILSPKAACTMEIGKVSEIFKTDMAYMIFKLEDRRPYEDPEARSQAEQMVMQQLAGEKQAKYL